MINKTDSSRLDNVFVALRKKLPHRYMSELKKFLPGLESKEIWYAMEVRCQDLELKEKVKEAMLKLAQDIEERRQKLTVLRQKQNDFICQKQIFIVNF